MNLPALIPSGLPDHLHGPARQLRATWERQHGVTRSPGRPCWMTLYSARCTVRRHLFLPLCGGPGCDHMELYGRDGTPLALVSHVYEINWQDHEHDARAWAAERGLVMTVDEAPSWYYPTWSRLVVYRAAPGYSSISASPAPAGHLALAL